MNTDKERESLARVFEEHAYQEGKVLAEYRVLAEKLGDGAAGTLVDHILTEEEMHHLLLQIMADWVREPVQPQEFEIPPGANRPELLRLTRILQQHERETIDACRDLKAKVSGQRAAVIGTLLEAMVLDSEKHYRLLAAVEELLTAGG